MLFAGADVTLSWIEINREEEKQLKGKKKNCSRNHKFYFVKIEAENNEI